MKLVLSLATVSVLALSQIASADTPAEEYYKQFNYQKVVEDDGNGEVTTSYHYLMGQAEVTISDLKHLMISAQLALMPDQTVLASYEESYKVRDSVSSEWRFMPSMTLGFCPKVFKGPWTAPVDKLLFNPMIIVDRATFDTRPSVKMIFNEKIGDPAAIGQEVILDYGVSNAPIEESLRRAGFCPF